MKVTKWGKKIKSIKQKTGITQEDLAKLFNVSLDTIKAWESRGVTPRYQYRELLEELKKKIGDKESRDELMELVKENVEQDKEESKGIKAVGIGIAAGTGVYVLFRLFKWLFKVR